MAILRQCLAKSFFAPAKHMEFILASTKIGNVVVRPSRRALCIIMQYAQCELVVFAEMPHALKTSARKNLIKLTYERHPSGYDPPHLLAAVIGNVIGFFRGGSLKAEETNVTSRIVFPVNGPETTNNTVRKTARPTV